MRKSEQAGGIARALLKIASDDNDEKRCFRALEQAQRYKDTKV